jgi:hypothetical protein
MSGKAYRHRFETSLAAVLPAASLFARLDDHEQLASHMARSSWMMAGSAMEYSFGDEDRGRAVGSRIRMSGRVLGLDLEVDEVVTERVPPERKVWETVGTPRLLIIGSYRMGFYIEPEGDRSRVTFFIEYDDPVGPAKLLGRILGRFYARWCTKSMAQGAAALDS